MGNPQDIYWFKVNGKNIKTCWILHAVFNVFIVDFEKSICPQGTLSALECVKPKTVCKGFVSDEVIT